MDDNLQVDKVNMETAVHSGRIRTKHAVPCQNLFRRITGRAVQRGMKVNTLKTAMLCISDATSYKAASYIHGSSGEVIGLSLIHI